MTIKCCILYIMFDFCEVGVLTRWILWLICSSLVYCSFLEGFGHLYLSRVLYTTYYGIDTSKKSLAT